MTIAQNDELLKHLFELLKNQRGAFKQQRTYERALALFLAEIIVVARHTISQLLMGWGQVEQDWSGWYRLFSRGRFDYGWASQQVFEETLQHVAGDEVYVVGGDSTQTPRSSRKIEGVGWLRNLRTPPFKIGIHLAQRWFNGSGLLPPEQGYSRAVPLCWWPCFSPKSHRQIAPACKEWEAALAFVVWLRQQLTRCGRAKQTVLLLVDGAYDQINLWQGLPEGVVMLARSAKNRRLFHWPAVGGHGNRRYGPRAASPQEVWAERAGWRRVKVLVRGKARDLQVKVSGPLQRQGAPHTALFLIVVRGQTYHQHGYAKRREPVPYLVNAVRDAQGQWRLPLALETLLFWAWQRWELEVCHRELKSTFGLGHKQCWTPQSAILSVQWSAWVYALLLLAGYRTWGLCTGPVVPTRWWRGAGRWSFNTLWRAYRAALWGSHTFQPLSLSFPSDQGQKESFLPALRNALFGAARF